MLFVWWHKKDIRPAVYAVFLSLVLGCGTHRADIDPPPPSTSGTASSDPNSATNGAAVVAPQSGVAPAVQPQSVVNPPVQPVSPSPTPSVPANTNSSGNWLTDLINSFIGGGNSTTSSTPPDLDAMRQACLAAVNQYRASIGRAPLTLRSDASTNSCVDGQASGDGSGFMAHLHFGQCGESAQDECPGWPGDPASSQTGCLQQMWAEGPGGGHYENMSNAFYTQVACGFGQGNGGWWMIQDFF